MTYEFIKELSEARLFRNPTKLPTVKISHLADGFFNSLMGLHILRHTNPKAAQKYAQQTLQYGNLSGWRTSGSDLHNMAHILINPRKFQDKILLDRLISFPEFQFKQYLRNLAQDKIDTSFDRRFFLNLQKGLSVENSGLKSVRRIVGDWPRALANEKQLAATRIYLSMQHDLIRSDMWNVIGKSIKNQKLIIKDAEIAQKSDLPLWSKLAIAGVAGYSIGKKLASL